MKWILSITAVILIIGLLIWGYRQVIAEPSEPAQYIVTNNSQTESVNPNRENRPRTEVVAENLTIPWEVLFLPDGELLVTERPGTLLLLKQEIEIEVPGVEHVGEGGLLGAALHPNFLENNFLYLYQTTATSEGLRNRVNRYVLRDNELTFESTIAENIPGARYHDGGRIVFGPDGLLYVTVGDAGDGSSAQSIDNLAGAILRYTPEGTVPDSNPYGNPIYSYGHRNPQGLVFDAEGRLWSSEHGRSGIQSGFDELNLIIQGGNYGWPNSEGDTVEENTVAPAKHSTEDITWAPGDLAYYDGSLYIPGLRGATLYEAVIESGLIVSWHEYLVGEYGRLRTVVVGPDDMLYLTTSNRDGRGAPPDQSDDLIIRIDPAQLKPKS